MEPVSIVTLVGVGLLMIERIISLIFTRVKKGKSKCSNCCELDTEFERQRELEFNKRKYNDNTKDEPTSNTNDIQKTK
jgi:hypothetical protein